jgi:prophage antirepressor-like protein
MNQVVPFQFETKEIRVIMRDGEPWWALRDVCNTLEIVNASDAAGRLEDDEKGVVLTDTPGGAQKITVVSEPGLYRLIMRSDKPVAKRFQRWVFHEVLPEIRKTGSYSVAKEKLPTNFDAIRALVDAAEAHETRLKKVEGAIENLGAHEDFKSIKAYAAIVGRKISTRESGDLGRAATAVSKQDGYKIGKQPDESFGFVNTYHRDVLARVFAIDT